MTDEETPASETPPPSRRASWRWPVALIVLAAICTFAGLYVFQSVRDVPGDIVSTGREALRDLDDIARAFRQGTITTSFVSYATEVSGSNYLQFATLKQVEVFERTDSAVVLWGQLQLPDVIVEARAPVEYTYYLDLDEKWQMTLEDQAVRVIAPRIRFNTPAVDASAIRYEVRAGSVFRDERRVLSQLQAGITEMSKKRAQENVELVREVGRRKTAEFIRKWLVSQFDDASRYGVEVVFADEVAPLPVKEAPLR